MYTALSQLVYSDVLAILKEGGIVGALVWFVYFFQRKWESLDKRHEELHEKILNVMSTHTTVVSQMTLELRGVKKELRFCQLAKHGNVEEMRRALEDS